MTPATGRATFTAETYSARPDPRGERVERLILLLHEAHDQPGAEPTGNLGGHLNGDAILLTGHDRRCATFTADLRRTGKVRCTCWQQSFTELDRSLAVLKLEKPVHHSHLSARHLNYDVVRRTVWYRHGRYQHAPNEHVTYPQLERGKTPPTQPYDCVLHVWRPWVDPLIVIAALDRLEQLYRGEVRLPTDNVKRTTTAAELSAA